MRLPAAAERMSQAAAAAALPTALSFARSAVRLMVRGRWRMEKVNLVLDADGRGEVLYRLHGGERVFHFYLLSDKLPEALKTDRNFAPGWDAMGVLCEGDWTPERELLMRREVPKQRAGFADYDTLAYARGNRSTRLFDAMVEQLAAGRQPDPRLVAPVGYVLRTTAFIANGQLGTRPLAGYPADHPLRGPYHAQFVSAFLLREFVFDLLDHLARVRSPRAVRLAPAYRRYLGIGNSAATGLVHYVANHPRQLQGWIGAVERTLAIARARPMAPGSPQLRRCLALLDRAMVHAEDARRPPDGVFAPAESVIPRLRAIRVALADYDESGRILGQRTDTPWGALFDGCPDAIANPVKDLAAPDDSANPLALVRSVLDSILLEVHEDLVAAAEDGLSVDETLEVDPALPVGELSSLLASAYGWALSGANDPGSERHFWYRTTSTPRDSRRGLRGRWPAAEHETSLDTVRQARALRRALDGRDQVEPIARLLFDRPDLRQVVARIQTLAGEPYTEFRVEPLAASFSPYASIRLILALFGLEKFEASPPKSVRGTFMQGAPIAEDVARGLEGTWPFPPMPAVAGDADDGDVLQLDRSPPGLGIAAPPAAPLDTRLADPRTERRIAPGELHRMVRIALQAGGASLGDAEATARIVVQDWLLGGGSLLALLGDGERQRIARQPGCRMDTRVMQVALPTPRPSRWSDGPADVPVDVIDANDGAAWILGPLACDLAVAAALRGPAGLGVAVVRDATSSEHTGPLAWRGAVLGCPTIVLWRSAASAGVAGAPGGLAAASPNGYTGRFLHARGDESFLDRCRLAAHRADVAAFAQVLRAAATAMDYIGVGSGGLVVVSARHGGHDAAVALAALAQLAARTTARSWFREDYAQWLGVADRCGIALPRALLDRLDTAGRGLLLPSEHEASVLMPGADPLSHF